MSDRPSARSIPSPSRCSRTRSSPSSTRWRADPAHLPLVRDLRARLLVRAARRRAATRSCRARRTSPSTSARCTSRARPCIEAFEDDIHEGDVFADQRPVPAAARTSTTCASSGRSSPTARSSPTPRRTATGPTSAASCRARSTSTPRSTSARACGSRRCGSGTAACYRPDVGRLIASNTRMPSDCEGDMHAQAEATRACEREILRLVEQYGADTVETAFGEVQDYVERLTRARIAALPDGDMGDGRLPRPRPGRRRGPDPDPGQADDRGRPRPLRPERLAPGGRLVPQLRARRHLLGGVRRHEDVLPRRAAELRLLPRRRRRPRPGGHRRQRALADRGHRLLLRALREDHERDLRAVVAGHAGARAGVLVQPRVPARRRPRRAPGRAGRSSCGTTGWPAAGAAATAATARTRPSPIFGVGLAVAAGRGPGAAVAGGHHRHTRS